jgi:hypothetical protein
MKFSLIGTLFFLNFLSFLAAQTTALYQFSSLGSIYLESMLLEEEIAPVVVDAQSCVIGTDGSVQVPELATRTLPERVFIRQISYWLKPIEDMDSKEATVVMVQGEVNMAGSTLKEKARVMPGASVVTGPKSSVTIKLAQGIQVRVGPNSGFSIDPDTNPQKGVYVMKLEFGTLFSKLNRPSSGALDYRKLPSVWLRLVAPTLPLG